MLPPWLFLVTYLGVGASFAAFLVVNGRPLGAFGPATGSLLCLFLWPFVVPVWVQRGAALHQATTPRSLRIADFERRLTRALDEVDLAALEGEEHRSGLSSFVNRLRHEDRRIAQLEEALAQAPTSAQGSLKELRDNAADRVEEGLDLLEELISQLTLLRFAEPEHGDAGGREQVEELLARMRELARLDRAAA